MPMMPFSMEWSKLRHPLQIKRSRGHHLEEQRDRLGQPQQQCHSGLSVSSLILIGQCLPSDMKVEKDYSPRRQGLRALFLSPPHKSRLVDD